MARYWVVSANVHGAGTADKWIPVILREHAAFMGWQGRRSDSKRAQGLARDFDSVEKGDAILLAYGGLAKPGQRQLVACGRADRRGGGGPCPDGLPHKNRIRLKPFIPLDDVPGRDDFDFSGTPYYGSAQPVAIFPIDANDPRYPRNRALCEWIEKRIRQDRKGRQPRTDSRTRTSRLSGGCVESYEMQTTERKIPAERAEQALVQDYADWLSKHRDRRLEIKQYECKSGWPACDAYDPERNNLIEAKASVDRASIRMAIGQLFDYRFLHCRGGQRKPKLGLLLPSLPEEEIRRLLESLGIALIWRKGSSFADSAKGRFGV